MSFNESEPLLVTLNKGHVRASVRVAAREKVMGSKVTFPFDIVKTESPLVNFLTDLVTVSPATVLAAVNSYPIVSLM